MLTPLLPTSLHINGRVLSQTLAQRIATIESIPIMILMLIVAILAIGPVTTALVPAKKRLVAVFVWVWGRLVTARRQGPELPIALEYRDRPLSAASSLAHATGVQTNAASSDPSRSRRLPT